MNDVTATSTDSAASPGAILKRCREYHAITLEEAEEATKIGANYLAALEDDQIGQFASLAYLKGFLRIYASFLGLNPDDMIRLYEKLYAPGTSRGETRKTAPGPMASRRRIPLQKLALPAILLFLILVTAALIDRSTRSQPTPASPTPAPATAAAPAPTVQQAMTSAKIRKQAATPDKALPEPLPNASPAAIPPPQKQEQENGNGVIVRLRVIQGGSLMVTIDGGTSQEYELSVGDSIEWKADRTITLELSNAGGVEVVLNGKQLKPFGPAGKPSVVTLTPEGIRS